VIAFQVTCDALLPEVVMLSELKGFLLYFGRCPQGEVVRARFAIDKALVTEFLIVTKAVISKAP
jgi:hypothetical protein